MFKSLGNILVNPYVGMLFIDFESPKRLRVNGRATMSEDDPLLREFVGAQLIVRVRPEFREVLPPADARIHRRFQNARAEVLGQPEENLAVTCRQRCEH